MDEPRSEQVESGTHSFIVKLWLDDADSVRGHITHVPSGERQYLINLEHILTFIEPYLWRNDPARGRRRGASRWLKLRKRLAGRKS